MKHQNKVLNSNLIVRYIFIMLGAILVSIGLEIFLVPNQIIDGGITGISIMLASVTGVKLGIFLFILNLPFLLIGLKQIGRAFAISTLFGVTVMSIGSTILTPVPGITQDPLLAAVFGGIIVGIGVGLVIRFGGSLDGTEIVAIVIDKKSPFSVGQTVLIFNIFILGSAGFVFGWNQAMYSLIAYFIAFKMIDITIEGLDSSKSIWIISEQHREIGEAILAQLGRGVTYLNGEGAFTGETKQVIFCVITRIEEPKLKSIVEEIDEEAFLAIGNIHEVRGGRFRKNKML